MNPDVYMPFFWGDFWQAVKAWPYAAVVGYQKALTYYWFHMKCEGLKDDSESLRKICELDKDEWAECCELIFDNDKFFKQDSSGLWRQKRADKEYAFCITRTKHLRAASLAGNKARWGSK